LLDFMNQNCGKRPACVASLPAMKKLLLAARALFFYLPRCALDAIADDADVPQIGDLNHEPVAVDDSTISNLGMAVLPALSHPDQASQLFIDSATMQTKYQRRRRA
jgi:hypothetical protein